jgi:hypothetical protein
VSGGVAHLGAHYDELQPGLAGVRTLDDCRNIAISLIKGQ